MSSTYPLKAERLEIQGLAGDFARREILPLVRDCEKQDISKTDLVSKITEAGLVNVRIPPELAGLGLDLFDTCLIAEELASTCSGVAAMIEASELALTFLLNNGTEEQKNIYIPMLANGSGLAGVALPVLSNSVSSSTLKAKQEGGVYVLEGSCPLVINAGICDWFIVNCLLDGSYSYFVVGRENVDLLDKVQFLGRKAMDIRTVNFEKVKLGPMSRLEISSADFKNILIQNSLIVASGCIGVAKAAVKYAMEYACQRKTFAVPIIEHQAIAFMLAQMSTNIEAVRAMIFCSIDSWMGKNYDTKLSQCAIAYSMEVVAKATIDSVQIFGAYGYSVDYPVEKLMRDARTYQSLYGNDIEIKEKLGELLLPSTETFA